MNKLKVAIIGCGRIAGYLEDDILRAKPCTHVGAYRHFHEIEITACCSQTEENARKFAERFDIPHFYTDADKLLKKEKPDIISITTHAPLHAELTIKAARSGVKGIFCEKAIACSLREADEMTAVCEKYGTVLSVNHTRRWESHYKFAKHLIGTGAIGTMQTITGYFSGNLIHTGTHMYDAMLYLAGKPLKVLANIDEKVSKETSGYALNGEDEKIEDRDGSLIINFEKDVTAYVYGQGKKYFIFELDVMGTEGRIKLGNGLFEYWAMEPSKAYEKFLELRKRDLCLLKTGNALINAVADLIGAVKEGRNTLSTGKDAGQSLEIALAAYESHYEKKGKAVKLPLKDRDRIVVSR